MEVKDLSHDEKVGLIGLVEAVAIADGDVSEGEGDEIGRLASEFGEAQYQSLLDEAEERFPDWDSLSEYLATIKKQETRELIYGTVIEEAMVEPSLAKASSQIWDWLDQAWDIKMEFEGGEDAPSAPKAD